MGISWFFVCLYICYEWEIHPERPRIDALKKFPIFFATSKSEFAFETNCFEYLTRLDNRYPTRDFTLN